MLPRSDKRFEVFVEQHYGELLRYAMVLTGNRDEAGDIVHDTLLKLVRHVGRGDIEHLGAYARRTLFRVFLRHRDRSRREPPVPEIGTPQPGADATEAWAGRSDMLTLLLRLPPRTRAVLAARFYLDLGEADTARLIGCGTGTVKSTTSRGLQRLRQLWEAESRSPENLPRPTSKGRR